MKAIAAFLTLVSIFGFGVNSMSDSIMGALGDASTSVTAFNTRQYSEVLVIEMLDQPTTPQGAYAAGKAVETFAGIEGQVKVVSVTGTQVTFAAVERYDLDGFTFCVEAVTGSAC